MTIMELAKERAAVEEAIAGSIVETHPAQRGAAWLDERFPGWAKRINLEKFDIEDATRCVLGQVFGDQASDQDGYWWACEKYQDELGACGTDFGFYASESRQMDTSAAPLAIWPDDKERAAWSEPTAEWAALQAEWRAIIIERQGA